MNRTELTTTGRLRWGILGTGGIAHKFAQQMPFSERGQLVAVGSRSLESAQHFATEFKVQPVASYDALLENDKVEAVYISLPNSLHHPWTLKALAAGKHVLCEKPLAASAQQAAEMFAAAEKAGQYLMEAFMYRCNPTVQKLLQMVHQGAVGELKVIRSHFTFNRTDMDDDVRYQPLLAGGSIMDVGCYCINLSRALTNREPTDVQAIVHRHATGVDDYAAGVLDFGGEVLASFSCGMTLCNDLTTYVGGSEAYLAIDTPWFSKGEIVRVSGSLATGFTSETIKVSTTENQHALLADNMAAVVCDEAAPCITKTDSIGNMRVLDALRAQLSAK